MRAAPDLTVVVPTFNGSAYLAAALTSLHRQEDVELETIVVDDGSSDDSVRVAESHPLAPRVIRQSRQGVAVARNRGLAEATAPWVGFIDQDDLWHPERAARLLALARETGTSAVATTEQAFAAEEDRQALESLGDGRERWPSTWLPAGTAAETLLDLPVTGTGEIELLTPERLAREPATVTTALLYRRGVAIAAGGCSPLARAADDFVLNAMVARLGGDVPRLDWPGLFYRVHPTSTTTSTPLAGSFLALVATMRLGGVAFSGSASSPFVDHLKAQLHRTELPLVEQAALLVLTTPAGRRARALGAWLKRVVSGR